MCGRGEGVGCAAAARASGAGGREAVCTRDSRVYVYLLPLYLSLCAQHARCTVLLEI